MCVFFFKQKTAYEMRISDWSSDVCSSDLSAWARTIRQDMRAARRVDIIAAYFCPTPGMLRRFDKAGIKRGSRVRIITAGKSDNNATIAAARFTYAGLLRKGVEVYEYQPTKLRSEEHTYELQSLMRITYAV